MPRHSTPSAARMTTERDPAAPRGPPAPVRAALSGRVQAVAGDGPRHPPHDDTTPRVRPSVRCQHEYMRSMPDSCRSTMTVGRTPFLDRRNGLIHYADSKHISNVQQLCYGVPDVRRDVSGTWQRENHGMDAAYFREKARQVRHFADIALN